MRRKFTEGEIRRCQVRKNISEQSFVSSKEKEKEEI